MRVLIADSDANLTQRLESEFMEHGYRVRTAANGRQCLETLLEFLPDVLVLDGSLPQGGCEAVLQAMPDKPAISHIPVVVLPEAASEQFDGLRYHNVVAWLRKPFQFEDLKEKVNAAAQSTEPPVPPVE